MSQFEGNIDDFGMDTISLAGPLEAKLQAIKGAGFTQVMLAARDLVGHDGGWRAAVAAVKASGLRVTGFQVLRDFEGLSGHLHDYKVDIAKSMLEMCQALDCRLMLACSSASVHATGDKEALVRDLRKLAMLAIPMNIKVAFEALSWGRTINEFPLAWDLISEADMPNLGLGFDSFHLFATKTPLEDLELLASATRYAGTPILARTLMQPGLVDQLRLEVCGLGGTSGAQPGTYARRGAQGLEAATGRHGRHLDWYERQERTGHGLDGEGAQTDPATSMLAHPARRMAHVQWPGCCPI